MASRIRNAGRSGATSAQASLRRATSTAAASQNGSVVVA